MSTRATSIEAALVALMAAIQAPDAFEHEDGKLVENPRITAAPRAGHRAIRLSADEPAVLSEREADIRAIAPRMEGEAGYFVRDLLGLLDAARAHPRTEVSASVREWARDIAAKADACHGLRDRLWRTGKVPDEDLDAILARVGPPPTADLDAARVRDAGDEGTDKPLDQPPWDDEGPDLDRYLAQMDAALASLPGGRWEWCSLANEKGETPRTLSGLIDLVAQQIAIGDSPECFLVTTEIDGVCKIVSMTGNGPHSANHAAVIAGLRRAAPWLVKLVRDLRMRVDAARRDALEEAADAFPVSDVFDVHGRGGVRDIEAVCDWLKSVAAGAVPRG